MEPQPSLCSGGDRPPGRSGGNAPGITRRELLFATPLAAAVAACRRGPYNQVDFSVSAASMVALLPASNYEADLGDVISRGLDILSLSVRGRRVLLKPNLVEYESGAMINTNPAVVAGAVDAFRRHGATEVTVAEGPALRRDLEYLLIASGLADCLRELRVPFVDLNSDDVQSVKLRSRFTGLTELMLPVAVLKSDFVVSMPKLKTHHWAVMTASMKNLFGVVPGAIYGWPKNLLHFRGIEQSILDLTATVRPQFAIVDAIVAMEGDGPLMGSPRQAGFIAMGADLAAVDSTCARIMGLDPSKLRYLRTAGEFLGNVDSARIIQAGEPPARFETMFDLVEAHIPLRASHK